MRVKRETTVTIEMSESEAITIVRALERVDFGMDEALTEDVVVKAIHSIFVAIPELNNEPEQ